jgi:hypothetical protein
MKYFTLKDAQKMAKQHPKTFEVPTLAELRGLVYPDVYVKVCGGVEGHFADRFWVKVTQRDGNYLFGMVANHLCVPNRMADSMKADVPSMGETIAFQFHHIYQLPILVPPTGMKVCEIQVCAMHNDEDGGVLADSEIPPLKVNGYDVLVRYCDVGDDPTEPEDILHIDDWAFDTAHEAKVFADYFCGLYTPDFEPEWI